MPKINGHRKVDFFLRIPPDARSVVDAEAQRQGIKPVQLGRQIIEAWASAQNSKTPAT